VPSQRDALLNRAENAIVLVSAHPSAALRDAHEVLAASRDPITRSVAERAVGLAMKELGDVAGAARHLRRAVALADGCGDPVPAARARMSLAVVLADRGDLTRAHAEIDHARAVLTGADAARALAQHGLILERMGRREEALACLTRALPAVRRAGDARFEAGVLLNRGALLAFSGELVAASHDLRRCLDVATKAGLDLLAALAQKNLAFVAMRRGDIPGALEALDRAESAHDQQSVRRPEVWLDRAYTLLAGRLIADGRHELTRAIARFTEFGDLANLGEARLLLAEAALLGEAPTEAREAAEAAAATLRRQRRRGWADLAGHLAVRARWQAGERSPALLRAARRSARRLDGAGWPEASLRSRMVAALVLIEQGRLREAADELVSTHAARRSGPADVRTAAWHTHALLRLAHGDRRGALAALRAGLRVVDEYAASLGATDLRTHAAGYGQELAELGLRICVESGTARSVLQWSERFRAGALRRRPVRPPDDRRLASDLAELRRVTAEISDALAAGRSPGGLRAAQVRLEHAIRDRSRHAPGGARQPARSVDLRALIERLCQRALVEYVRVGRDVYAVTVVGDRIRLHRLGSYQDVLSEMASLRFCMHRLARRHGSGASLAAARLGQDHAAALLDDALLGPIRAEVADREVVLVPTMALHALPWTALPALRGRPVSVSPSADLWLTAAGRRPPRRGGRTLLVAGPGLQHAEPEVRALARHHPDARLLTGADATVDAVRAGMDGAALVHIAAHGRFRGDNPQFSCLELADGPLTVYDLERLRRAPRRLVLSACDSGLSAVHPGDEVMGLTSAMFALGTATLIASVTPVPDDASRTLMVDLHGRLAAGVPPARALAEAQQAGGVDGFVCFGAG